MKPLERFETERLVLRIPRTDDAPAIFAAYAQDGNAYSYAIALKDSEAVIGMIALHPDDFKVGLGYVLAHPHWGKGYMTEAVRVLANWLLEQPEIYRVFAVCDMENFASARVMEKAGMIREGILLRNSMHPNVSNEPRDSYIYSIVK